MKLLTVAEAADVARCHPETVAAALRAGKLHGHQTKKRAPWVTQKACVIAWRLGQKCSHD
ncbi:helix-turn-helix domain-containing protein [Microbacterium sp. No. 7]|uniref:helix-turn-helix domain-containing protein n=1 Tax=Microbacterium sp. No. 7 TaxID=1714373 RepID=UPI0006CF8E27|nr:helix-turn-helix domain-containing protein [Microbacterium sp. No. 7]ALJ19587.1 hypothetical protein AOA12_06555 [Microbacterium sp. No. 7]